MSDLKLSIIIPVLHFTRPLNKKRFFMPRQTIADTLADIQKNVTVPHEVIIICNGQDRELLDFISKHPAVTRYAINSQNAGVARSWNMGAQLALGETLCYLNDDVSIGKNALETLCKHLDDHPEIGEIGPAGSFWKNCEHHNYAESVSPIEADVVSGFCFLIKTKLFHELGGFDINFTPAGCEEIDLSYRVRQAGYKCVVYPDLDIKHFHHHGVSAQKVDIHYLGEVIDTETLHKINSAYFKKKWANAFN